MWRARAARRAIRSARTRLLQCRRRLHKTRVGVSSQSYRGRFAPSPTGPLHSGSLVSALASWLDARANGGAWLVRVEDIGGPRTMPGAAEDILATLAAFGFHADEPPQWQSRRTGLYRAAL
ncbi:MAG: tRNA glutamyl-Q(34) synthetase GluQRS, partial [Paraburkholderia sp.]|nr:tRNA glutamyl-Q(34) synthetase GluQRS [Paraburkholderia sp.]